MNNKKKKYLFFVLIGVVLLLCSFVIYQITGANSGRNKIKVGYAKLTSVKTGGGSFNASDGLDYSDTLSPAYSADTGYTPGNDANDQNRIVRSFDTITYNFDFKINPKSGNSSEAYDSRTVEIKVDLSEEESKYVLFDRNDAVGVTSKTFSFDGIDTYDVFSKSITLYVLGAPNGTTISPKFTLRESEDEETSVVLGKASDSASNYTFENDAYNTTADFTNYLPSVVSSKDPSFSYMILKSDESQQATYDSNVGRYITYVVGVKVNGDPVNGIKGLTMPTGDITYNFDFSQSGSNTPIFKDSWGRLYSSNKVEDIDSVIVNMPYSDSSSGTADNRISNPGSVSLVKNSDTSYKVTVSGYNMKYSYPLVGADNGAIDRSNAYVSTLAFTVFSPRTPQDGKSDINVNAILSSGSVKTSSGETVNIDNATDTAVNKYYESNDYSLDTAFYDGSGGSRVSPETVIGANNYKNGAGSVSKGTVVQYKTVFNYSKTLSDQGLKEVIKFDDNAYRVIPFEYKKDYEIEVSCGQEKCLTSDDFEVKFISGSFDSNNYEAANITSSKLSDEDKAAVSGTCSSIVSNLGNYNVNQIQNLYGSPCIKAKEGTELTFDKLSDAKTEDNKEVPITKVIIQTKEGIKLPDMATVTIKLNVRVRNVSDISQTYQATTVASTSDYDNVLSYYSPNISDDEDSVTNPDNYRKTTYSGRNITDIDNSLFGDSLRIVNFTTRSQTSVKNKNKDGSIKTNYNTLENETITYNVKTIIQDNAQNSGADDEWFINDLFVTVFIPKGLNYINDSSLIIPTNVTETPTGTYLEYSLPYTKPNMELKDIEFKTKLDPTLIGNAIPLKVETSVSARNINGEEDYSVFTSLKSDFTIYATGLETIIVSQKVGEQGTVVEKNSEFSYLLDAYNNTLNDVDDYSILDVLPYQGDENKSIVNGSYKVKITMPNNLAGAKIYCTSDIPSNVKKDSIDDENNWTLCNITEDYLENVTAIKITNISIVRNQNMGEIKVSLLPTNNKYSDSYNNSFIGATTSGLKDTSNKINVKVVSRRISGRVFIDVSGNGIKDGNELYVENVAATLYSLDNDNALTEVARTTTDKNGYYEFKDLDSGRYKVRFYDYNSSKYDLTLRYATMDTTKDSDAYKISDNGEAEISNKKVPDDPNGIRLTRTVTSADNMDMGLIPKESFGFSMRKYITKIDLAYNGSINTTNYDNQSSVSITVRNSLRATAKVYYGIAITNTSTHAGFVNLVQEDIPSGMVFDKNYAENSDWFEVNGVLQSEALSDVLIKPGETKYLQIALFMPTREEAGTFLNTASVIESTLYEPEELAPDKAYSNNDNYVIGDALSYGGVDWHVISASSNDDNSQTLTLLADSGTISTNMGHTEAAGNTYKWSQSQIRNYINSTWLNNNTVDTSKLYDQVICDDASGLESGTFGGSMTGYCVSGIFDTSKVRLLTLEEFTLLTSSNTSDLSWLLGSSDFWLQNTDYVSPEYMQRYINAYNNSYSNAGHTDEYEPVDYHILQNSVHNKAMYIDIANSINKTDTASKTKEVRPVITISTNSIVVE